MRFRLGLTLAVAAMLLLVPIAAGAQHAGFVTAGIAPPLPITQPVLPAFGVSAIPVLPQWPQYHVNPPVIVRATGPVIVQHGPFPIHYQGIPNHVSVPVITPGFVIIQTAPVSTFAAVAPARVVQAPAPIYYGGTTGIVRNGKHLRAR